MMPYGLRVTAYSRAEFLEGKFQDFSSPLPPSNRLNELGTINVAAGLLLAAWNL